MDEHVWSGPCLGGPLHTYDGTSRFPSGFLLVDRSASRVWIYDYVPFQASPTEGAFEVRVKEGVDLIEDYYAPKNRYRAAEEKEFDVKAADWSVTPPWQVGRVV